jgi:hypothetical protein
MTGSAIAPMWTSLEAEGWMNSVGTQITNHYFLRSELWRQDGKNLFNPFFHSIILEGKKATKCKDDFAVGFYTHPSSLPAGALYSRKKSQQAGAEIKIPPRQGVYCMRR